VSRLQWAIAGRLPWNGVWLNRHYLARELVKYERVVYLLDPRPWNPLRRASAGSVDTDIGGEPPEGMRVLRTPEPPLLRFSPMRRLGRWWSRTVVTRALSEDARTVLVYFPRAGMFEPGALGEALTVYFCSDDFRYHHDGERDVAFCRWEDDVLDRADVVIGVSDPLCRRLAERHPRVRLVKNGIDPELFRPVGGPEPADIAGLPRPRIGFVGTVRAPLIDLDFVGEVAEARPGWTICLVGCYDEADPGIARARERPNVVLTGPRPRAALARYIAAMDVMTCPYVESRVTAPGLPLKAFESLAVGRPLVGVHAPELDEPRPYLRNTESLEEFLAAVGEVLRAPPEIGPEVSSGFAWRTRAGEFREHVLRLL
jgi:glycosyltransferase involved in cell wall biosynthesis